MTRRPVILLHESFVGNRITRGVQEKVGNCIGRIRPNTRVWRIDGESCDSDEFVSDIVGPSGLANVAGTLSRGRAAPGELISIYRSSLGNRVLFGDTEATILYASRGQINTVVPFDRKVEIFKIPAGEAAVAGLGHAPDKRFAISAQ